MKIKIIRHHCNTLLNKGNSLQLSFLLQFLTVFFGVLCGKGEFTSSSNDEKFYVFVSLYYYYFELLRWL